MSNAKHRIRPAKQSVSNSLHRMTDDEIYLGFTGLGDVDKTVLVPGKPGYVYIRIPKRIVTGSMEEYSEHIAISTDEYRHNVPVKVVRNKKNPVIYEVAGLWIAGMGFASVETMMGSAGLHHPNHELYNPHGGHDPVMLDTMQIKNLQVVPTNPISSRVIVGSGWYIWKDRTVHWYDGTTLELAETIPSGTNNYIYDSLWLDPETDTITQTLTPNVDIPGFQVPLSDLVQWPTEDYIPLACVRLQGDTYQIDWSRGNITNFIDMRPHQALMPGDMLPAVHPLNPPEGYHSGSLDAVYVRETDPSGTFTYDNLHDILEMELGPERTKARVSSDDTTPDYLENKFVAAGGGVNLSVLNPGGNEKIQIESTGTGGGTALTVEEIDGTPSVPNVDTIRFPTGTVTDDGGGQATVSWALIDNFFDASGDLITARADNIPTRFPVGSDGRFIVADSTQLQGLKYRSVDLEVINNSGATANVNDVGYVDFDGSYKTTSTASDARAVSSLGIVLVGGANGASITIRMRGNVTVKYTGSAPSTGDYLVTAAPVALVGGYSQGQTYCSPEIFAVCTAAGSGGFVAALLLANRQPVPVSSTNYLGSALSLSDSDFVSTINGAPTTTLVTYGAVTSGVEANLVQGATDFAKYVLWNTTRGTARLISSVNTGTNQITTPATVDAWANGDTITLRSQTTIGAGPYFIDFDVSTSTATVPKNTVAIWAYTQIRDSSGSNGYIYLHPYETLASAKIQAVITQVANVSISNLRRIPISQQRFTVQWSGTGAGTFRYNLSLVELILAVP